MAANLRTPETTRNITWDYGFEVFKGALNGARILCREAPMSWTADVVFFKSGIGLNNVLF